MPSRPQLLARLRGSYRYEEGGGGVRYSAGLAYMIVTGLPADGSDVLTPEEIEGREGVLQGPTQPLVNPPTEMPKHKSSVEEWMKHRTGRKVPTP